VNKPNGDFGGIVVVSVDPSYFTEFYGQVDLGESSLITLVGRDGIVRARKSEAKSDLGQDIRNSALLQHASESPVGRFVTTSEIDGIHRIHSYRALEAYPFVVSVGISEEEVFRELNERIAVYYWVAAVATSVITLFIIALLMVTARQRRTEEKLMKSRATLECEVEKRTQELLAANEELTAMNEEHVAMNEELQHTNQELHKEIVDRNKVEDSLKISKDELEQTNRELVTALATIEQAQRQLIQQEKLAGIGQLAAGVAHEINNPLGYVTGNVETLEQYFASFEKVLACYRELQLALVNADNPQIREKASAAAKCEQAADLDYIQNDLPSLFRDTIEGLDRMSKIVKGMRVFSRIDQHQVFAPYDLLDGLESTLLVAHNEIKHCASVVNNLHPIPKIEAVGSEINQVLLNLIVNAAQSIKSKKSAEAGLITLSTWHDDNYVYCSIEDNGIGIAPANLTNLFNLFFTTKPVGHGTGMGLSISYDIIATRHNGDIWAESIEGHGAKFTLKLPIRHSEPANENQ
jgi:signal transduction histidine kinase